MNTMDLVPFRSRIRDNNRPAHHRLFFAKLIGPARKAIFDARHALLNDQRTDGSWQWTPRESRPFSNCPPPQALDTLLAIHALCSSGLPTNHYAIVAAIRWLLRANRGRSQAAAIDLPSAFELSQYSSDISQAEPENALPPELTIVREADEHCRTVEIAKRYHSRVRPLLEAMLSKLAPAPTPDWYANWISRLPNRANDAITSNSCELTEFARTILDCVVADAPNDLAALRAVHDLVEAQNNEGAWRFSIRSSHGLHNAPFSSIDWSATAWALLALSRWAVAASSAQSELCDAPQLRLVCTTDEE